METLVKILHVIVCIFLMLTVLLQAGKGGGMGAAFGGGTSMGTVFGGSGAGNFLRRLTVGAAVIFMLTSMTLAWMSTPSTDPLEKYWAQQHRAAMDRDKAHKQALGNEAKAPADDSKEGPEGEGIGPDEMIDTPEDGDGDDAIDTPESGAGDESGTSDAVDTPDPDPADEVEGAPAGTTAKPGEAKKPPAKTPKPKAKPVPPPAAPVAPPPGSSSTPTTPP
jgi:preprotein translocase subunit SecG